MHFLKHRHTAGGESGISAVSGRDEMVAQAVCHVAAARDQRRSSNGGGSVCQWHIGGQEVRERSQTSIREIKKSNRPRGRRISGNWVSDGRGKSHGLPH